MLNRLPTLCHRLTAFVNQSNNHYLNQTLRSILSPQSMTATPVLTQIRGFKDKEVLKIRCNDCYFKYVDNRWWVLCPTHPRHKQRQQVDDIRRKWIVTHITRTGRPFKKHFQYPGHDL